MAPPSGTNLHAAKAFIEENYKGCIKQLASISKALESEPTRTGKSKKYYEQLDEFLHWLENNIRMTPDLRNRSKVVLALEDIYTKPELHFPEHYQQRARQLYERWEANDWQDETGGDIEDLDMNDASNDSVQTTPSRGNKAMTSRLPAVSVATAGTIRLPPPNHSIWGLKGIMHGAAMRYGSNGRHTIITDPRYFKTRRSAKIIGANGLDVGTWYPRQLLALLAGAHGHLQSGIVGNRDTGAFSILVSGQYDLLDQDHGTYLYYSGSGSHENDNPREAAPSTSGTLALHASLGTGNPVRVLRNSTGKSRWAPRCGMRYDGLYQVVSVGFPRNGKGGMYEQFKLERMDGQGSVERLIYRPTAVEMRQFEEINRVNTAKWERYAGE